MIFRDGFAPVFHTFALFTLLERKFHFYVSLVCGVAKKEKPVTSHPSPFVCRAEVGKGINHPKLSQAVSVSRGHNYFRKRRVKYFMWIVCYACACN